jgi:acetyl-CoA acetyltransferase
VLTEGGGALILVSAERARDFPQSDIDHPRIYGAFADLPICGLGDLGIVPRGEAEAFIVERNTAPGGKLPLETNGGGLSYMHSGMVGRAAVSDAGGFRAGLSR